VHNSPYPCVSYTSHILALLTSFHGCQNIISSLGCQLSSAFADGKKQCASEFCVRWCLELWNSAMWVAGFPQQQPYGFHSRNRVLKARRHFICKSVGPFDNFTVEQRNLSAATSSEFKQELHQVATVKLQSPAPNFMTASKWNVVFSTFCLCSR